MLDAPGPPPDASLLGGDLSRLTEDQPPKRRRPTRGTALALLLIVDVLVVVAVIVLTMPPTVPGVASETSTAPNGSEPDTALGTRPPSSVAVTPTIVASVPGSLAPPSDAPPLSPPTPPPPSAPPSPTVTDVPSASPSASPAPATGTILPSESPPPPTASASVTPAPPGPALPPPPASFVPAAVRWYGDARTGRWGELGSPVWTSGLAGSDLRRSGGPLAGGAVSLPGERLAYPAAEPGATPRLFLDAPGQQPLPIFEGANAVARDPARDAVYVGRSTYGLTLDGSFAATADRGVWRVPLDRSPPVPVLPPVEGAFRRDRIVAAADGSVASSVPIQGSAPRIQVSFAGGASRLLPVTGQPLGFDDRGRLIYHRDGAIRAYAVNGRQPRPFPEVVVRSRDSVSMPDGRHVLLVRHAADGSTTRVEAHHLDGAAMEAWSLDGSWVLTDLGGARYLVLESRGHRGVVDGWHAVIDLRERWLGYVPPIPPP